MNLARKSVLLVMSCFVASAYADESLPVRVKRGVEHVGNVVAHSVERGVNAAAQGIEVGAHHAIHGVQRGAQAAAHGVKVGTAAVARVEKRVEGKVAPSGGGGA